MNTEADESTVSPPSGSRSGSAIDTAASTTPSILSSFCRIDSSRPKTYSAFCWVAGGEALSLEDLAHRERFLARKSARFQDRHRPREVALRDPHLPALLVRRQVLVGLDPRAEQRGHRLVGLLLREMAVQRRTSATDQRQAGQQQGHEHQALVCVRRVTAGHRPECSFHRCWTTSHVPFATLAVSPALHWYLCSVL